MVNNGWMSHCDKDCIAMKISHVYFSVRNSYIWVYQSWVYNISPSILILFPLGSSTLRVLVLIPQVYSSFGFIISIPWIYYTLRFIISIIAYHYESCQTMVNHVWISLCDKGFLTMTINCVILSIWNIYILVYQCCIYITSPFRFNIIPSG